MNRPVEDVELTKQQRVGVVAVIIAGAALAIDRFVVPQDAAASAEIPAASSLATPAASGAVVGGRSSEPTLAERLGRLESVTEAEGRTDAFMLPTSMLAETGGTGSGAVPIAEVGIRVEPPVHRVLIRSVVDGTHPVVVIDDAAVRIGGSTSGGIVLVGLERGERGSYFIKLRDADGSEWIQRFIPGVSAPVQ